MQKAQMLAFFINANVCITLASPKVLSHTIFYMQMGDFRCTFNLFYFKYFLRFSLEQDQWICRQQAKRMPT